MDIEILGYDVAKDWEKLKPYIRSTLKEKKVTVEEFAEICEQQLTIPATILPESIRHHFSKRTPSSYAQIDMYLKALRAIN